jgi:protein TonB
VLVSFCVNEDGSVNPVLIYKGVDPELDNEAVRVIGLLPAWKPGILMGKPVRVWYTLPVTFSLK